MISNSVAETNLEAVRFLNKIRPHAGKATIVALSGDLGSGKTTFTKAFAGALGISPNDVTSPTFVIEKRFDIGGKFHFNKFIHIDAYRLEKPEEILAIGWKETISNVGNLILIEWPENIGDLLPADSIKISFKFIDENTREIVFN